VFEIVGQCRELGDDPLLWRSHLNEAVARLVGARVAFCGEVKAHQAHSTPQLEYGWEGDQAQVWYDCLRERIGKDELIWQRMQGEGGRLQATVRRCDYVPDRPWYLQDYVQEGFRGADVDRLILSDRSCSGHVPTIDYLVFFRAWGEKRFSQRECRLVGLLHDEIAPLIGGPLAARGEPVPSDLPPRKQQVLECLLMGATDKQIAKALHLSRPTVSEYVGEVLRHFGVASRAELVAAFLKRYRQPRDIEGG